MGVLPQIGPSPGAIPGIPVRLGCIIGAGLFCILFVYTALRYRKIKQALKEQQKFDDEVMGMMPGLKLREVNMKDASSSTPQRWMDDMLRRHTDSQRVSIVVDRSSPPPPPPHRTPTPPQQGRPPLPPDHRRYSPTPHEVLARDPLTFLSSAFGFQAAELQSAVNRNEQKFKEKRRDSPVYL